MEIKNISNRKIQAIDLFCGVGGLTYGLNKVGIEVKAGLDCDSSCRYAYTENNQTEFIDCDISQYSSELLFARYDKDAIKVLVGCAPCQTFSTHTHKIKDRDKNEKWNLLYVFADKIRDIKPDIVSMENVPGLVKYDVFTDFLSTLDELGYQCSYKIVCCEKYGIPQSRKRLVLLASKLGKIKLIPETHPDRKDYKTVQNVIGKLPILKDGSCHNLKKMHRAAILSEINKKRIKQSRPGGTWLDWDKNLLPECYKKKSGKTYTSVYGRLNWSKPSSTITTQFFSYGTGRFGHPDQDRALSLLEGALLQTFPASYKFIEPGQKISLKTIGRHIGNAVPVRLGKIIGQSIKKHIGEYYERKT